MFAELSAELWKVPPVKCVMMGQLILRAKLGGQEEQRIRSRDSFRRISQMASKILPSKPNAQKVSTLTKLLAPTDHKWEQVCQAFDVIAASMHATAPHVTKLLLNMLQLNKHTLLSISY